MDLKNFIEDWGKGIDGVLAVAVLGKEGFPLAGFTNDATLDVDITIAYFIETIKNVKDLLAVTRLGNYEEIVITSDICYIIVKSVNKDTCFGICVHSNYSNLGMLQLKIKNIYPQLISLLEENK